MDRIWRVKSKHSVCALSAHDLDGDGIPEVVSGWNNGRVSGAGWDGVRQVSGGGGRQDGGSSLGEVGWVRKGPARLNE